MGNKGNKKRRCKDDSRVTCYHNTWANLVGEGQTLKVSRGRNEQDGDHLFVRVQRLIEKEDLFNNEVISSSYRHKRKLVTCLEMSVDTARVLCLILTGSLGLNTDSLCEDGEMRRIIMACAQVAESKEERKKKKE